MVGYALLPGLTTNQQNALGNFFMGVGQTLETVAAQQAVLDENCPNRLQELQQRMKKLEERLSLLENHPQQP